MPYLPGLDGLRAIAVVAVMIYHAHHSWLPGGFLGVEVFFIISGYLITLLLIGEHERTGTVNLRGFWKRRFRRLLPALYVMMAGVAVYTVAFYPAARERTRGDFVGGIFYISNWYQILVGQGYAASEAFVPLRHLWSLAVEEQFYFVWPLLMLLFMRRRDPRPSLGVKLIATSLGLTVFMGVVFAGGFVPAACSAENSNGYWHIFGRCVSINDTLYLSSITRAGGLMLGAGFAVLWRPMAILRGPMRFKHRRLDVMAAVSLVVLLLFFWKMYLFEEGAYNPWLFRGGFFATGIVTLFLVAAVTHQMAAAGGVLGNPLFRWIGTRSYGLYLYHWPIYQIIRKQAQIQLTLPKMLLAWAIALPITELSYRFVETPIRTGQMRAMVASLWGNPRTKVATLSVIALLGLSAASLAVADAQCLGAVECSLANNPTDGTVPDSQPATTVPTTGSTALPTTSTTVVPDKDVAVGESVMVGAASDLQSAAFRVNAKENRGPEGVKNAILQEVAAGHIGIGTTLVVQVGTNSPVNDAGFAAIMAAIPSTVSAVVFMTVHAPVSWVPDNNARIKALPTTYPDRHVTVLDWDAAATGAKLCPDGIHLTCSKDAPKYYANLILHAVGLPVIP